MADETSEHDTFVSVDIFAPTQSSVGAQNLDLESHPTGNDTVSLSEYIGDGVEDLLVDDPLDHVSNPNPSPQDSRAMRLNTNRHDSAFMWTLTNEPSPEAFRLNEPLEQVAAPADETLSLGDDGDVCGSFDTGTFTGNQDYEEDLRIEDSPLVPETPPSDLSHPAQTDFTSGTPSYEPRSPCIPCSSERPPLPPSHSSNVRSDQLGSFAERRFSAERSETSQADNSTHSATPSSSSARVTQGATPENRLQVYNPRFDEASHGFSTSVIENPFFGIGDESELPREIVVISKTGQIDFDDRAAFHALATSEEAPKCRLVKRLVETIVFQRHQLEHVKDSEVSLAGAILNDQLRRYSDVAHERSFAIDGLIEEVDSQRERILELERENEALKSNLQDSENKIKQVEEYYSNFVGDFNLSENVVSDLENVNEGMEQFRRKSAELSQKQATEVEDYARRLLKMEDIADESRKRVKKLEMENDDLRTALEQVDINAATSSGQIVDQSPLRSYRRLSTPDKEPNEVDAELMRKLKQQDAEIENLRLLHDRAVDEQKTVQEAFLSLNVELEEARSKSRTLQKQRDTAESRCRELNVSAASEKKNFMKLSNEMSKNIVQVINELDQREADMRQLRNELEDRESAFRSLQCSNQDLEDQLQAFTEAALDRSRSKNSTVDASGSQPLVDAFIKSLEKELRKAQSLLQERTDEVERVKRALQEQDESIISLQKECSRLHAAAAIRRRASSVSSPSRSSGHSEEEDRFLRRLSEKLGYKSNDTREIIEQLSKRVEALALDREEFQSANEKLRYELAERERGLHKLRSEMQAEISALKAEAMHLENLRARSQDELKSAEDRLLHVLNEGDISRRESMGDITVSSVGTRAWMVGDEDSTSRRASMLSSIAGDDTIRWSDPIIDAAVQSVSALIGTKDSLAERNRELREKLQALINALAANDQDGSARAVIIQSKELQDELTGVVGMQQDIIDKLTQAHSNNAQTVRTATSEETLPFIHQDSSHGGTDENHLSLVATPAGIGGRAPLGEATRFLNEQLASTRSLYSDKLKANVELCGVVEELQEELQQYKAANHNVEIALGQLQDTHAGFIARLAEMTGTERSVVALEDFIRASLHDMLTLQAELERKEVEERVSTKRIFGLVAQKQVLTHIISLYQSRYRLNILASPPDFLKNAKRRLRVRIHAVVAIFKLRKLPSLSHESSAEYFLPQVVDISHVDSGDIGLMEASLALTAVPRLEKALVEKEYEITKLVSSIESLNRTAASRKDRSGNGSNEIPRSSYVYEEDVLNRKNDLSRRLQKMIREKEDLEERLSREKQSRLAAEAKAVKYMEKVSTYKKRLGKISSHAESKENAYKAAIRYLKNKADKAVQNDFNLDDENVAPWEISAGDAEPEAAVSREPNAATRAMLQDRLICAEAELADQEAGSSAHEELKGYANGLRRAIQRLEKPIVFSRRSRTNEGNRPNAV